MEDMSASSPAKGGGTHRCIGLAGGGVHLVRDSKIPNIATDGSKVVLMRPIACIYVHKVYPRVLPIGGNRVEGSWWSGDDFRPLGHPEIQK